MGAMHDPDGIYFYGGPFSSFAPSLLRPDSFPACAPPWAYTLDDIAGKSYIDVEHLFQSWKASTEEEHDWIKEPRNTWECKKRGNSRTRIALRPDWEQVKYEVMVFALRLKFRLPEYRAELLATGDRNI